MAEKKYNVGYFNVSNIPEKIKKVYQSSGTSKELEVYLDSENNKARLKYSEGTDSPNNFDKPLVTADDISSEAIIDITIPISTLQQGSLTGNITENEYNTLLNNDSSLVRGVTPIQESTNTNLYFYLHKSFNANGSIEFRNIVRVYGFGDNFDGEYSCVLTILPDYSFTFTLNIISNSSAVKTPQLEIILPKSILEGTQYYGTVSDEQYMFLQDNPKAEIKAIVNTDTTINEYYIPQVVSSANIDNATEKEFIFSTTAFTNDSLINITAIVSYTKVIVVAIIPLSVA